MQQFRIPVFFFGNYIISELQLDNKDGDDDDDDDDDDDNDDDREPAGNRVPSFPIIIYLFVTSALRLRRSLC